MAINIFGKGQRTGSKVRLDDITLRNFGGGINAVDSDLGMQPNYLVRAINVYISPSGTLKGRFGSKWWANAATVVTGDIVDMRYFNGHIVAATQTGQVSVHDITGSGTAVWNSTIAAGLPGAPAGWGSGIDTINFVEWKDNLILHNGRDKPITFTSLFVATYLQDLATGSNVNVPIGRYGCTVANYHCVAGIPLLPTTVYISAKSTSGTFPGDPDPNDAISIDVGAYASDGAPAIRGIVGYKNLLIVFFLNQSLVVKLGNYDADGNHVPEFPDTLPKFGLLGHRCIIPIENDIRFAGFDGVSTVKRNVLVPDAVNTVPLSVLVTPLHRKSLQSFTLDELLTKIYAVYDGCSNAWILSNAAGGALVYSADQHLKYKGWTGWSWGWTSACSTILGRVFMSNGTNIYQLGNDVYPDEDFIGDFINMYWSAWANSTIYLEESLARDGDQTYVCLSDHTSPGTGTFAAYRAAHPGVWTEYLGIQYAITIELPWLDGRDPMQLKQNKFISIGTKGTGPYTIKAYVDRRYYIGSPDYAASMSFRADEAVIGNIGGDARLYNFSFRFKSVKFVIEADSELQDGFYDRKQFEFGRLSSLFLRGKYRR